MALTKSEVEAKLAALEDRISLLFQATDSLEWRLEHGLEIWEGCAVELQVALAGVQKQIGRLRKGGPPARREQ